MSAPTTMVVNYRYFTEMKSSSKLGLFFYITESYGKNYLSSSFTVAGFLPDLAVLTASGSQNGLLAGGRKSGRVLNFV